MKVRFIMKRVLIAEDESAIREIIGITLRRAGYEVTEACDGQQALDLYSEKNGEFDVVLLDIMMPNVDGLEVCKRLRSVSGTVGIIMLTAKTQEMDKVSGLLMGADDYITKPFNPIEVIARVKSQLRRYMRFGGNNDSAEKSSVLRNGGLELDDSSKTFFRDGEQINLTPTEMQLLKFFMENLDKVFSPKEIYRKVWGDDPLGAENTVTVHIRHLREKIEINPARPDYLKVIWGHGYKMEKK